MTITPGSDLTTLFTVGEQLRVGPPSVPISGEDVSDWAFQGEDGGAWRYQSGSGAQLWLEIRPATGSTTWRFRFRVEAAGVLTKVDGEERLRYASFGLPTDAALTEIELAHFDANTNIYKSGERTTAPEERYPEQTWHGPILIAEGEPSTLIAYEHGGDSTIRFLEFVARGEWIDLVAVRGSYLDGQPAKFESPWFQISVAEDGSALRKQYREFLRTEFGTPESRQPYVFYNTWNHQERLKYLHDRPYLSEMTLERMLKEIDVAHEIGIEVFVIDTGWYAKTGDWDVSLDRFPDGLQTVRARLEGYGMKLGLWFNPIVAAKTSRAFMEHPEWVRTRNDGTLDFWGPIWETEESYGMCVCSGWAEHFAETLIRLNRELGVTYFKWDAIGLYGCSSPDHDHGTAANSVQERSDRYGFESGRRLTEIVERVTAACPEAIVDFDVTESGRYFGLGFLSAGKFFLVNNGPYFHNFDIPKEHVRVPETINVFFNPGAARARICRGGYRYDPVVPSVLYLTHYLPDGPRRSQDNALASLVLGGNGIWGSLPELLAEDREFWATGLSLYKSVRESVTRAYPRVRGEQGTSPEIHEKLDSETSEGVVAFFTVTAGGFDYVTQPLSHDDLEVIGADEWSRLPDGRLRLRVELEYQGARTVFVRRLA